MAFSPVKPERFSTLNSAVLGDRTSQICSKPEYVADARVNGEVGWHDTLGTGEVVGRVREMTEDDDSRVSQIEMLRSMAPVARIEEEAN